MNDSMTNLRIFVSSVQSEFEHEREAVRNYLRGDPLMRQFFDVFLFEDSPAVDRRPNDLYLNEVERCSVYVGLFGSRYGSENEDGISPTEREFNHATEFGNHRLIFVKQSSAENRHPKMQALIDKVEGSLIRRRFNNSEELVSGLYAALVEYLITKQLIRSGPFDAAPCLDATLDNLDTKWMARFIRTARRARNFPLTEDATPQELLAHLNLQKTDRLTNAAVLLFGKSPQRFLISSEIKCAHFHGTDVSKPIPSYQVYKGTAFELVDQAVDFVLSKIALSVGTRSEGIQAPVTYEIPKEVIIEAVVNAVAHRDYTSNGSVQVMLFSDRLEVRNPGRLSPSLTLENLRNPHSSIPVNPLLAESLYLVEYIERMGTGTLDMIRRCRNASLPEPEFAIADGFVTTIYRPNCVERYTDCIVTVRSAGEPLSNVDILALFPNKTWKRSKSDKYGEVHLELHSAHLPMMVFAAAEGVAARVERNWIPAERALSLELDTLPDGGAVIFPEATGYIPGLKGRLNPLLDTQHRNYLYANNVAINEGQQQPVHFNFGDELRLADADGNKLRVRIVHIEGRSALVEYRGTLNPNGQMPKSQPESLKNKFFQLLVSWPMLKSKFRNIP